MRKFDWIKPEKKWMRINTNTNEKQLLLTLIISMITITIIYLPDIKNRIENKSLVNHLCKNQNKKCLLYKCWTPSSSSTNKNNDLFLKKEKKKIDRFVDAPTKEKAREKKNQSNRLYRDIKYHHHIYVWNILPKKKQIGNIKKTSKMKKNVLFINIKLYNFSSSSSSLMMIIENELNEKWKKKIYKRQPNIWTSFFSSAVPGSNKVLFGWVFFQNWETFFLSSGSHHTHT